MSVLRMHGQDADVQVFRTVQTMGRLEGRRTEKEGMAGQLQADALGTA